MSNPNPPNPSPDQIQQAINATTQGVPLEVRLETGQVYRGATPQDVLNQLVAAQTEASRTITSERAERARIEHELATVKAQIPAPPVDASDAEKQAYYQKWAQNPDEALQEQFGKMLGIPASKVTEVLKRAVNTTVVNSAADEFMARYPNFPPAASQLMNQRLKERFGESMDATTADNLELVYGELVRTGRITPEPLSATGVSHPYTAVANLRGQQAPPNPMNQVLSDFASLPLDKMREALERMQAQGIR